MEIVLMDKSYSAANKHNKYWASMRQLLSLCRRSPIVPDFQVESIESELSDILDSRILIYPPTICEYGIDEETSFIDRKDLLHVNSGSCSLSQNEEKLVKTLAENADKSRKSQWRWRIANEAKEKAALGWYPFFVTLTVDPNNWDAKKLWQEGRAFRKYIRKLVNIVCKELGHPPAHKKTKLWPYRPESDYLTYAGVIEHGSSREHHHAHFLIWMREIPDAWKQCPNRYITEPKKRTRNECIQMRRYWKYSLPGLSKAMYFRSIGDIWLTKHRFACPIDAKKQIPMKMAPAEYAGNYVTKYLQKDHKEWQHRMKATRNLGMKTLITTVRKMKPDEVKALTWRAESGQLNHFLTTIHSLPLGLVRRVAKQTNYYNQYLRDQWDLKNLIENRSGVYTKMLSSARAGHRPDRMLSMEFYDWVLGFLPAQDGYCEKQLIEAHHKLSKIFPKQYSTKVHTSIGGNRIGHTQSISYRCQKAGI
jgi:hypothetical protein